LAFTLLSGFFVSAQSEIDYKKEKKIIKRQIKALFKELKVGDTIRMPFSTSFKHDGTERTSLFIYSAYVGGEYFECEIEAVIVEKNKKREKGYKSKGYNLVCRVINVEGCGSYPIVYDGKEVVTGQLIKQNMKYFKIIARNTAANSRLAQ
jgi:hypothetical protein